MPEIRVFCSAIAPVLRFQQALVSFVSFNVKNTPETHRYALQILLNTPILSLKYARNSRVLPRKCIRFTS